MKARSPSLSSPGPSTLFGQFLTTTLIRRFLGVAGCPPLKGKSLHTEFGPLLPVPQCLNPCTRGALKELLNCTQQTELNVQPLGLAFLQPEGRVVWPLPASVSFRGKSPSVLPQNPPPGAASRCSHRARGLDTEPGVSLSTQVGRSGV